MSRPPRTFPKPIQKDLGGGYVLQVPSARLDDVRGVLATVQLWNGTLTYPGTLHLTSDVSRRRYVKGAAEKAPALDSGLVDGGLIELSNQLEQLLRTEDEAATTVPAPDAAALWAEAQELAEAPDLLGARFDTAIRGVGLVGEKRNGKLVYLGMTSRLREKPINVVVKGLSSSGKSHLIACVLKILPAEAYVDYTSVSPRYLAYCDDDLRHRVVVLYEAAGVADGIGAYILRSLLSENRLSLGTVDKSSEGANEARRLEKEGPTMLLTSTTRTALDGELETRALGPTVRDDVDHSRAIMHGIADGYAGKAPEAPDLGPWHALQRWLAVAGETRVRIPYAGHLAAAVKIGAVRIRRDFAKLLELIAASAILHQKQRPRDDDGTIVASLDDYALVRDLLYESFAAAQQDGLTPAQRAAVGAVTALCIAQGATKRARQPDGLPADDADETRGVSLSAVAERLKLDKSAAQRRLANPLKEGYLQNLETRKGRAARYVPGEPLPAPVNALPTVDEITAATGAEVVDL